MEQKNRKKDSDFAVLGKLFSLYAKHNREAIVSCVILSLVDGTMPYIMIILSGVLIDGIARGTAPKTLFVWLAAGLSAQFAAYMLSSFLRQYFNARLENCLERQNFDLNERSMRIDYEHLEDPEVQEKKRRQERLVNVWGGIYWMIIVPLDKGLSGLISVVTALAVAVPLFLKNETAQGGFGTGWMSCILLVILVTGVVITYKKGLQNRKKIHEKFREYDECCRVGNYLLHNILEGSESAKDLRIFGQERLIEEGVCGENEKAAESLKGARRLWMCQRSRERTLSSFSAACVYLYAAFKAWLGLISVGSVVRYAASIIKCVDGFSQMLRALSDWREAANYGREYLDYVNFESKKYRGSIPVEKRKDGRFFVEFEHVSFRYPGSATDVIKDLNLKFEIGERMAIVGRNGSGKTTFIKLLCRLYDVTEGAIYVNGVDIRKYDYDDYMRLFSVVFQDYRMFSLKLGENIAASEEVDRDRAMDALHRAGLAERMAHMPYGLDTFIGKDFETGGVNVSGGERQKMAIARAIYKGAPFVIMDEPTAALDPVSECEVYAGFDRMVGSKTAIYISHRLASCRFCSDILVFDRGQVVQRGSHEKLIGQEGIYKQLWDAQAQYYQE